MEQDRAWLLGIDLGTSSVKALALRANGQVLAVAERSYAVDRPRSGWAEQSPEIWWLATCAAVRELVEQAAIDSRAVQAIGMSGQMHGTVVLDTHGQPLRPAIIWMDGRATGEADLLTERVTRTEIMRITGNRPNTGFMALSLLWLQRHEPETWRNVQYAVLPKDFLTLRLTGQIATDVSDAAGTLLFDVNTRQWSPDMCAAANVTGAVLPPVYESQTIVGTLLKEAADTLGLPIGVPLVVGGGDSPCAALAGGVTEPTTLGCTIGTAAQLVWPTATPQHDPTGRVATMCHVLPDRWYTMGAILNGGSALAWVAGLWPDVALPILLAEAASVPPGADGLLFLPYLNGERSPYMDANARGAFFGLNPQHRRAHMLRAVLEGVAFALNDNLSVMRELGLGASIVRLSGGAARSPLWAQIVADVFALPVGVADSAHGSALGAALLAGLGVGLALPDIAPPPPKYTPDPQRVRSYADDYAIYQELYPALKKSFGKVAARSHLLH